MDKIFIEDFINKNNVGNRVNLCLGYLSQIDLILDYEQLNEEDKHNLILVLSMQHKHVMDNLNFGGEDFNNLVNNLSLTDRSFTYTMDVLSRLHKFVYSCMKLNEIKLSDVSVILDYLEHKYRK